MSNQMKITDEDFPLRGLKILRKNNRKKRKFPEIKVILANLNTLIKVKQAKPRPTFPPSYINRNEHKRRLKLMDSK